MVQISQRGNNMRCNKYKNLQEKLHDKKVDSILLSIVLATALGYTGIMGANIKSDESDLFTALTISGLLMVAGTGYEFGKTIKQYKDVKKQLGQNANGIKRSR